MTQFLAKLFGMCDSQVSNIKLNSVRYRFATYGCWQFTHFRNNCTKICRVVSRNCNYRALPLLLVFRAPKNPYFA